MHSLRTCSFLKTGARGSRPKIPMRASVSLSLVPCSSVIRIESYLVGEVGKLLGAKWKELDDTEKKVRYFSMMCISEFGLMLQYSHISTKLLVIRREPMRRRLLMMFVNVFSPALTKPESLCRTRRKAAETTTMKKSKCGLPRQCFFLMSPPAFLNLRLLPPLLH